MAFREVRDATTHRFEPRANGLEQTVVADDPDDTEQVDLIRQHELPPVSRRGPSCPSTPRHRAGSSASTFPARTDSTGTTSLGPPDVGPTDVADGSGPPMS